MRIDPAYYEFTGEMKVESMDIDSSEMTGKTLLDSTMEVWAVEL